MGNVICPDSFSSGCVEGPPAIIYDFHYLPGSPDATNHKRGLVQLIHDPSESCQVRIDTVQPDAVTLILPN